MPLLFGMFGRDLSKRTVVAASVTALAVHFTFRYGKLSILTGADWTNPGLTATYGLLASLAVAGLGLISSGASGGSRRAV